MRMVGIIAAHWEWIEAILERSVAEIMEHDPNRVAVLTVNISFHPKCDIILAHARAFEKAGPPQWSAFTTAITRLKNAYTARNRFVHAKWKMEGNQIFITDVRTKGGRITIVNELCPIEDLNLAAQQIIIAGEMFCTIMQSCGLLQK